ncbi:MAG: hypothetical protein ACI8RZ_003119 [Myxococcota bacterium]|jgi:hypothetical protein
MTAALLLARAGHRVRIFERGDQLGGLWASRLDDEGCFRGDNSCKVYQSSYHTTPALFELIGTDWREHFTGRHDLTTDWLRPFVADCTWRDLAVLAATALKHRAGLGNLHRIPVTVFMEAERLSEPCQAWLRATALGGIAGTLRMTVWELFHRLGSNIQEIFRGSDGPLYWNTQPPNTEGGFITRWREVLDSHGVTVVPNTTIASLSHDADGVVLKTTDHEQHSADAVFLAVPPPALATMLSASPDPIAEGFGLSRPQLDAFLGESVYEHVGVAWFFDTPLPNELPLGGHNVRRGWHPILVQHQQYQPQLATPAVSVVVGSVAVDTTFRHHRLGTRASEYDLETLAALLWEDERLVDPTLPEPIDMEILGNSSATQIVHRGPLPLKMAHAPIFLTTNLHGQAPYFTASLESAIQAGAIAAQHFEPSVERLPMGPARGPLPWSEADRFGEDERASGASVQVASHAAP